MALGQLLPRNRPKTLRHPSSPKRTHQPHHVTEKKRNDTPRKQLHHTRTPHATHLQSNPAATHRKSNPRRLQKKQQQRLPKRNAPSTPKIPPVARNPPRIPRPIQSHKPHRIRRRQRNNMGRIRARKNPPQLRNNIIPHPTPQPTPHKTRNRHKHLRRRPRLHGRNVPNHRKPPTPKTLRQQKTSRRRINEKTHDATRRKLPQPNPRQPANHNRNPLNIHAPIRRHTQKNRSRKPRRHPPAQQRKILDEIPHPHRSRRQPKIQPKILLERANMDQHKLDDTQRAPKIRHERNRQPTPPKNHGSHQKKRLQRILQPPNGTRHGSQKLQLEHAHPRHDKTKIKTRAPKPLKRKTNCQHFPRKP